MSEPITPPEECPACADAFTRGVLATRRMYAQALANATGREVAEIGATPETWEHELRQARERLESVRVAAGLVTQHVGCGDGGCRFIRPSGMHTNAGCRCVGNGRDPLAVSALAVLYEAAKIVEGDDE